MKMPKKPTKLAGRAKKLAGKYIAEEVSTGKYNLPQTVAIGISRAKRRVLIEKAVKARLARKKKQGDVWP
jgi:hypothetical protein